METAPSMAHQADAMINILRRYQWKAISVITSSIVGHDQFINTIRRRREEISKEFNFELLQTVHLVEMDEKGIRKQLIKIKDSDTRIMLLLASKEDSHNIFAVAAELGLTADQYMWIVTQSAVGNKQTPPPSYPVGMMGIYFDTERKALLNAISEMVQLWGLAIDGFVRNEKLFRADNLKALLPDVDCSSANIHWKNGRHIYEAMKNATEPATDIPYFNEDGTPKEVKLQVVNLNRNRRWEMVGKWTDKGLEMQDITWPGDRTTPPNWRPKRYHVKVITLKEAPYVNYANPDNVTGVCPPSAILCRVRPKNETIGVANATRNATLYQCCSGFCIDLMIKLAERIGFEFELSQVEDKKWGSKEKNNEWNGLPRALLDKQGDMVMTSLKITPERSEVVDFSVPFLETGITIIVAIRDGVISPTAFLEPYDYPSWCLILVFSVHATGAAIFIFDWLSPNGMDQGNTPIREHRFSLFRAFWLIWAMLFAASVNTDNPRGVSSRFMASVWALFAVVFLASYTANLAAFMIAKEDFYDLSGITDWRLRNAKSLKPPFRFGTVPFGSTETNLIKNYPKMYKYMREFNRSDVDKGVKAVKDMEIDAFIYDATVLQYRAAHDDLCKLRTVGKWYAMTGYGVAFPKGSKWIPRVNKELVKMTNDGTLERLQKFWLGGACKKTSEKGDTSHPLQIKNFTSAFILLAGGMLLGIILLILEHFYFKFVRPKLRKWDKGGYCGLISLSMGKSLTFQESVFETTEMMRHHRCKNPICETQLWKAKHELDLALIKVDRLQKQMHLKKPYKEHGIDQPAIAWHKEEPNQHNPEDSRTDRKYIKPDKYSKHHSVESIDSIPPPPSYDSATFVDVHSVEASPARSVGTGNGRQTPDSLSSRKKSRSLNNSPKMRKKSSSAMPTWRGEDNDDLLINTVSCADVNSEAPRIQQERVPSPESAKGDKNLKKRKHKGNLYHGIDSVSMEKETVL
ncbi:glutamate receptor ionotropic, NMDA 2B-like isoform X2 [Tubulanus polymorphus]